MASCLIIFLRNFISGPKANATINSRGSLHSSVYFQLAWYCLQWLVKCIACFTVFQMKKHPEALNCSWDGSQQTLNSTWGNPAVTLQLILLLNPTAEYVCVCMCVCEGRYFCFLYLSDPRSDEALTHTYSYTDSFKPTNIMCQENNKFPLQLRA